MRNRLYLKASKNVFIVGEGMKGFISRHIGPRERDIEHMLSYLGVTSLDDLIAETVPETIQTAKKLNLPAALSESEALSTLKGMASRNVIARSYLGMGYHNTKTPSVILRNLIENPGWYTSYTPYQAEISQGRLEALLIFQTMVQELTGMEVSNSSLLDEATAAAEAMTMSHRLTKKKNRGNTFFVSELCHPNTIEVVKGRAKPLGLQVIVGNHEEYDFAENTFGVLLQYPATDGAIIDYRSFIAKSKENKAFVIMAVDLLSLTVLTPPGELGVDIVVGNSQRFGVPLGYGGPHAAFLASSDKNKRSMPGRIIGVSVDSDGNKALRMALQTREQHIRRASATSNVCTAQALLANVAAMYAVYHGPEGLKEIALSIHTKARILAENLRENGLSVSEAFFDTVCVSMSSAETASGIVAAAVQRGINLRQEDSTVIIALDECTEDSDVDELIEVFGGEKTVDSVVGAHSFPGSLLRESEYLSHHFFQDYRSETDLMRYLHKLAVRDLALDTAMIPLGSCTMKLNAATEMIPVTWEGFNGLHPYAPDDQAEGYAQLFTDLETWLAEITGFDAISLQPNAGSQGEYAGLLTIRAYHDANGDQERCICLIPTSAHGTNPASAVMAGMTVVEVLCDDQGNIDVSDLRAKAEKYSSTLAALMVTYPSTHGVFEESIKEVCQIIHDHGGQVYMDGANMNAMVGICRPGEIGADVCHLNLHKTFCIPHGGGGPGMGPIGVKAHLEPHLPGNPLGGGNAPVSAAPYGSSSILPISWAYIAMCGADGLTYASKIAILSANYIAAHLQAHYPILYTGKQGRCAHECILDVRHFKDRCGVTVDDIAKRLIDYGFHAPTMSWPVAGTLMVEPTESEPLKELDRFIEAMIRIRQEIAEVENERYSVEDSPLRNAPHNATCLLLGEWNKPYSREVAAFPTEATKELKYWPPVRRVDNAFGDRKLVCSCTAWSTAAISAK